MFELQCSIGVFPVSVILLSNGTIAWIKTAPVKVILDMPEEGIGAVFCEDYFTIGEDEFQYRTLYEYKHIPSMLAWLKQQKLQQSDVRFNI